MWLLELTLKGRRNSWVCGFGDGGRQILAFCTDSITKQGQDIIIAAVDGLTGFPEATNTVFPKAQVQLCIVHMVRNSLKYVSYKDRKAVATDLANLPINNCRRGRNRAENLCPKMG
ncbi:MAG: hypothetical protein CSA32_00695 [Desulfobulbus propionicus]|nr:MAG: hypothetical protein CSA32_00695 [Desulfobulbus propionicus]